MQKTNNKSKPPTTSQTVYPILFIIGLCHLLNDSLQAVIPAMFPILEKSFGLTFTQLGLITFTLNMVSSVMQPLIGIYTDKRPMPYALPLGLTSSMFGMLGLALAPNFLTILISVLFIGLGSAIFHPEGSRVAYLAAGTRRGLAQSIYQVGGNSGQALAPLITALVLVPLGQFGAIWFTLIAALAVFFLIHISKWYAAQMKAFSNNNIRHTARKPDKKMSRSIKNALIVLVFLVFARSWYAAAISNFYAFYAIENYGLTIAKSQIYVFTFLFMGAVGTFFGGPLADRFGKKNVILISLLAPAPLALVLPHIGPVSSIILLASIGFLLMSSFSVSVVYAQELVPGKIGTMSGLIVGLAFGMGAIGSVALGSLIDLFGLTTTMIAISLLPLLGILTYLLPSDEKVRQWYK
ncbi:MFS transporter [Virgibacillus necropolis]|uniref:MFS transporter n=1 Tax=Virgibacillus necropolis TaxID=163877 RepID=A0A221M9R5_9BACI|nr:MFS transporter [Virgibacillus necropolis]ASN04350.1 MFS transporter [Virgibacillus necropolis]